MFAVRPRPRMMGYTQIPTGANAAVLVLGFPLGFAYSAIFSGFGSFLAELYPTALRGTGQGFTYNFGRALGAFFPTAVGFLATSSASAPRWRSARSVTPSPCVALLGLPETEGHCE